jgi:lipoprotein-anchoring transpeptidase ErfK/SrfK
MRLLLATLLAFLALAATAAASPTVTLLADHTPRSAPRASATKLTTLPARTPITESRTVLPLLGRKGTWLRVRLPGRPNGHTGWIVSSQARINNTPYSLIVSTARRTVSVYRSGRRVHTWAAVVGAPGTPTPHGRFFVEEPMAIPGEVGGPYALALSARSNVFQEFEGGPGQVAIHGRDNLGGTLGQAQSHGCVRLATGAITWLATRVPAGATVTIT